MSVKKSDQNKKALIIIAIIIATLFTVGSALAYYNSYKDNLALDSFPPKLQMQKQMRQKQVKSVDQKLITGEVLEISDDNLSLDVRDENWQVKLSSKTRYRENGNKISRENIKVGNQITIFGKKDIKNRSVEAILVRKVK